MHLPFEHMARTDTRKTSEAKLDAQFGKWNAQIALLKAKADIGKVIGKQGRTAQAMRTLIGAVSAKINKRTVLETVE